MLSLTQAQDHPQLACEIVGALGIRTFRTSMSTWLVKTAQVTPVYIVRRHKRRLDFVHLFIGHCLTYLRAVVLQRLLNNAREASKVTGSSASSSSSSASNSGSEDEQDSSHSTHSATHSDKEAGPQRAAEHEVVESPAKGSPQSQTESNSTTTSETLQVPSDCSPACGRQQTEQRQAGQAVSGPDNTLLPAASPATSAATSAAASTFAGVQAACEERPSRKRRWRPSWYSATEAGNSSTGQGSAPQPWWTLDSWVTAPAELQFQR